MEDFDIVIVGGGMVGLSLALALRTSALRIAVIDPQFPQASPLNDYDLRVSAINSAAQRFLHNLGVWSDISAQRVSAFERMEVVEKDSFAQIAFDAAQLHCANLGHIVENSVLRYALWQALCEQGKVSLFEASIDELHRSERGAWLRLNNQRMLNARLLVGADGANSWLRQQLNVPLTFWDYEHRAIVATIRTEQAHQSVARQWFSEQGILAFLPLDDPHLCSIVWSLQEAHAMELMQSDVVVFNRQLAMANDMRLGLCQREGEALSFSLRMRYARDFAGAGFALIGDAAHTIHPLAGQGVNLGLMDAATLAETLLALEAEGKDIGEYANLRHFERWRKNEAMHMVAAMEGFKRLFATQASPIKLLRGLGMNMFNKFGPLKQHAMKRALGLSGDLPKLAR